MWYHGGMDITAYWLNHKKRDAGEGKVYYLYPYTRCEADDTPTLFIGGSTTSASPFPKRVGAAA